MNFSRILAALFLVALAAQAQTELSVPAFTAYLAPDVEGARVSGRSGITGWDDPKTSVLWFGDIKTPGPLNCAVALRLRDGAETKLRLTVAGQAHETTVRGTNAARHG